MGTLPPTPIPFPLSTFPGASTQESGGRLINAAAEPLGPGAPSKIAWHRQPGLSQHAATAQSGYRGGLIVANLSYECWSGEAATVDVNGNVTLLGSFPGTKTISIARNQASPPNVVAVDLDNGAFILSGGGAPASYNGGGNLPQPNSVCFQDGYFFYGIANNQIFASPLNSVGTINALTFITMQAKATVTGQRVIAFSGLLFGFTTASCEVWQDAANPAPAFPYSRLLVLEFGLIDPRAIAGWEEGFSTLIWVAQDFGVYQLNPGSLAPSKISPPDLDRLIEAQARAGNTLQAGCYIAAGKRFWHLSSPAWTWEFNLNTSEWNERESLAGGLQGRWRGVCGHPAFGKWLIGDTQTGTLAFTDDTNFTELGAPQLFRIESGAVDAFPNGIRVARADFDFVVGVGQAARSLVTAVTGTASGNGGVVRLSVISTTQMATNDTVIVAGVGGTTEANGTFPCTVIDATHLELQGTHFVNAYTSGGTVTDVTSPSNAINPVVAISWSDDGGNKWSNPLVRSLGVQSYSKRTRVSVKNTGLSGPMGRRWRLDITDPVYTSLLKATQSNDPREYPA